MTLIIWLFSSRIATLLDDFPQIQRTLAKHLDNLSIWISKSFGYSPAEQVKFINMQRKKLFSSLGGVLSGAAVSPIHHIDIGYQDQLVVNFGFINIMTDTGNKRG